MISYAYVLMYTTVLDNGLLALECRSIGLATFWSVSVWICLAFGISKFRFVDVSVVNVSVCQDLSMSTIQSVGVSVVYGSVRRRFQQ